MFVMPMTLAPQLRYSSDSARVENCGPSITTYVPPRTRRTPAWAPAASSAPPNRAHTGSAMGTWATQPVPKKVLARAKVRSMNWSTTTKVPGARSSLSDPTADNAMTSVTPARFRTSMLARKLISPGGMRWPRPWRGRKTTC